MSLISASAVLTTLLFIAAPLVAAILVGTLTRGRVRGLGVAGFGLFVADGVLGAVWQLVLPQVGRDLPIALLATAYSAARGLLGLAAVALLAFAVIADRGRPVPAAR